MSRLGTEQIIGRIHEVAERVASEAQLELVDVQLVGGGANRVLRIYIDKPKGVSHADCELVSHQVGAVLDAEDVIPGAGYTLEVSSPGVERKLSKVKDFERFVGHKAKVALRVPVENERRWQGSIAAVAGDLITLEPSPGRRVQFTIDQVERANLKFEW